MNRFVRSLLTLALWLPLCGWAQDLASLDGNWLASYVMDSGRTRTATLELSGGKGRWQVQFQDRNDVCLGKSYPAVVSDFDGQAFKLAVMASQTLQGCPNQSLSFRREGDKGWAGEFGNGRKVQLERR